MRGRIEVARFASFRNTDQVEVNFELSMGSELQCEEKCRSIVGRGVEQGRGTRRKGKGSRNRLTALYSSAVLSTVQLWACQHGHCYTIHPRTGEQTKAKQLLLTHTHLVPSAGEVYQSVATDEVVRSAVEDCLVPCSALPTRARRHVCSQENDRALLPSCEWYDWLSSQYKCEHDTHLIVHS